MRDCEVKITELQHTLFETQETHKLAIEGLEQQLTTKELQSDIKINELKALLCDEHEAQKLAHATIESLKQQVKEKDVQLKKIQSEDKQKVHLLESSLSKAHETQKQALKTIEGLNQLITNKELQLQHYKHENNVQNLNLSSSLSDVRGLESQKANASIEQQWLDKRMQSARSRSRVIPIVAFEEHQYQQQHQQKQEQQQQPQPRPLPQKPHQQEQRQQPNPPAQQQQTQPQQKPKQQQHRVDDVEQPYQHASSLVLEGLPSLAVFECENLTDLVISIAKLLQVNLKTNDLSSCYRLSAGSTSSRIPPVLINFKETTMRDQIFFAYLKKRSLTVRDLIPDHRINNRLYLNEFVTDELVKLLQRRCFELKKKKIIMRYFTTNGKLFLEKEKGDSPTLATPQLLNKLEMQ